VDAGGDSALDSGANLAKKHPGPCATTLVTGGKTYADYIRHKYDAKGRKVDDHTWADAGKYTFTHTWSWDAKDRLAAEKFDTTSNAPNVDYKFSYDATGKLIKKQGSTSSFVGMLCVYEYNATGGKLSLEHCQRTWELFDDEGEVTGTQSDAYIVEYTHGNKSMTEEHLLLNSSSPDKTVWRTFDDQGRLIKLDIDWSTGGIPEESTVYTWGADGNLAKEEKDFDVDGSPEWTLSHSYDFYGNPLLSVFSHGADFPAATADPLDIQAKPYELHYHYDCKEAQ